MGLLSKIARKAKYKAAEMVDDAIDSGVEKAGDAIGEFAWETGKKVVKSAVTAENRSKEDTKTKAIEEENEPVEEGTETEESTKCFCAACGSENAPDAKFCTNCGNKFEQVTSAFCPECGAKTSGEKFCAQCGHQLIVD